jgi:hypothetical protein
MPRGIASLNQFSQLRPASTPKMGAKISALADFIDYTPF